MSGSIRKILVLIQMVFSLYSCQSQDVTGVPFDENPFDAQKLPLVYDLRGSGRLPAVRVQPPSGCWASAANSSLESAWLTAGIKNPGISDNNLKMCHGFVKERNTYGNQHMATAYYTAMRGPLGKDADNDSICQSDSEPLSWITDARFLPSDPALIRQVVMNYGAVYTMMYYKKDYLDTVNHTYYYNGPYRINHSAIIAGWNDSLKTAGGKGAWIVQNSRSKKFGDNGFFYVSYADMAFLNENAFWPKWSEYDPATRIFMYDTLGSYYSYGFRDSVCCGLVRFTAEHDIHLNSLATWVNFSNTRVTFEVYSRFDPAKGVLSEPLLTGLAQYCRFPGYYTVETAKDIPIAKGSDFYVMARYVTPDDTLPMPVETFIKGYSDPHITSGTSWVNPDNLKWPTTWYVAGSNSEWPNLRFDLCIRAIGEIRKKE